jgi:DNA/RNA endonuclease G (NUC1)
MPLNVPPSARRSRVLFALVAALFTAFVLGYSIYFTNSVRATSSTILISEFRTRGPAGANDEFIELYNATNAPVDIGGWKINRSNGSGTINTQVTITAGTMIPAHGHFLATNSAAGGYSGSVAGNQTYGTGITDDGGIGVLNTANVVIDQVGMSAGSAYKEGTVLSQLTTNVNRSWERKPGDGSGSSTDTDNNGADFQLISPSDPQNLASAPTPGVVNQAIVPSCPASLSTTQGTATSTSVSASDPDGRVVSATITSAPVTGITLDSFTPAAGVGGTASATLNVSAATAQGNYNVVIQYANNDSPTPQTATCTVAVSVTPPPTPTPTPTPTPVPGSVVLSQVYGGGGNNGSTLKNDFIEIINHTGSPINLNGWSVQYASAMLANWQVTPLTNFTLGPGQYYLIKEATGAGGTVDLPTADQTGTIAMGATSGKVALVSNTTALVGNCPVGSGIVDFIGYDGANCFEGAGAAPTLTNPTAALRKNDGCLDTDNNNSDFVQGTPNPRNSSSPTNNCAVLSGIGSANPLGVQPGDSSTLTVTVFPASDPTSTGITVSADLTSIGGSAPQAFAAGPGNTFTFVATVSVATAPGQKSLPVTINDAQGRTASTTIALLVQQPHVVISQLYGGGGNTNATYANDFVELYNPSGLTFDLSGWSLQYTSATGDGWEFTRQPLGGTIAPGQYYLIALASGGGDGIPLPAANINGDINMSASTGKVALVNDFDPLVGNCPLGDPHIVDFLGYGVSADCSETARATAPSATTAIFRANNGATDSDNNQADFAAATPNPRRTAPIVEIGPAVFGSDPRNNGINAPRDASITINFTEPVDVVGNWFNISCATTGLHNDATVAGGGKVYVITPNVNFLAAEQCTFTIFKDQVHDTDTDDSGPNTDTLSADYVATFTVSTGTAPPYPPTVHTTFGNPSNAVADPNQPNNYLMQKPEFTVSYNRDLGRPNWVSWHLSDEWIGNLARVDTFRPDPAVLPTWYRVQATDFSGSGFDRGHMTPNADRDKETSIPINQATFLMSNMVAQAPDNNQGPWAAFESFLRTLLPTNELYIVSGPAGVGGTGSNGFTTTLANGHVTVPNSTWKVVLVLPKGDNDLSRVTAATRTIAIIMPNAQGIRNDPWQNYLTTVDAVETLTGYDFFANVPDAVENSIEAGTNGTNPPGTEGQAVTTAEDTSKSITLTAVSPNPSASFSFTIVTPPAHGQLTGSGANRSYQPDPDFNGNDSFAFKANDGAADSNISTVSINVTDVNDSPSATDDSASTDEDTPLQISASTLSGNDSAGPANENLQVLTVTSVSATADTHGTVSLSTGTVSYSPDANYNGPASFTYQVCDNGTTNGAADPQCTTGTVNVTVNAVNDAPSLNAIANQTVYVGSTLTLTAVGSDIDLPAQTLTYSLVGAVPSGASINPTSGVFSWTPTAAQAGQIYTFTVRFTDDGTPALHAEQQFTVGVAYTWSNLLAPVQAGGTYKAGRTIPIKFQLTGASAGVTNAVVRLVIYKISNNVLGDPVDVESTSSATTGNLFRYSDGQYIFNLDTSAMGPGTYQLQVDMGDGVLRAVNISLR